MFFVFEVMLNYTRLQFLSKRHFTPKACLIFRLQICNFQKTCLTITHDIVELFLLRCILQIFMLCCKIVVTWDIFCYKSQYICICVRHLFAKIKRHCAKIIRTRSSGKLKEFTDLTGFEKRLRSHRKQVVFQDSFSKRQQRGTKNDFML